MREELTDERRSVQVHADDVCGMRCIMGIYKEVGIVELDTGIRMSRTGMRRH